MTILNSFAGKDIHESFLLESEGTTVIDLKSLQEGTIVEKVLVRIVKAAIGASNLTVGDDDSANGYITAADATAAAGTVYGADPTERGAYLYDATKKGSFSKFYQAIKTLKFVLSATPETMEGQYEVTILGYRITKAQAV